MTLKTNIRITIVEHAELHQTSADCGLSVQEVLAGRIMSALSSKASPAECELEHTREKAPFAKNVTLRLTAARARQLKAYCDAHNLSRSAAVRELNRRGILAERLEAVEPVTHSRKGIGYGVFGRVLAGVINATAAIGMAVVALPIN